MKHVDHSIQNCAREGWLPQGIPDRSSAIRLFCFHHAGGNAIVFRSWQPLLAQAIHVCAVELPGHGTRMREAPSRSMADLVDGLVQALAPWLTMPFSFFGHSMGAALAFELTHRLQARHTIRPECLFVSGCRAPGRPMPPAIHGLPEHLFIEKIRGYSGTPDEVFSHAELLAELLPMLRADFAVIETRPHVARSPLDCPLVAFGGLDDSTVSSEDLIAWGDCTSAHFSMRMFAGDHFYLNRSRVELLQAIASHLLDSTGEPAAHRRAQPHARAVEGGRAQ